jgi:hypothetical protein
MTHEIGARSQLAYFTPIPKVTTAQISGTIAETSAKIFSLGAIG